MSTFMIKTARPLFRRQLRQSPAHPLGERVLVQPFPPEKVTEGGIHIAEKAQKKYMAGILIAAGDQAADKLRDIGVELGDEVWYAQYAGLIESWQHIVGEDKADCPHDSVWEIVPADDARWEAHGGSNADAELRACRSCGTLKLAEEVIVMDVADVCLDVTLQERFERGEIARYRDEDEDGRTRYMLDRRLSRPDSFETCEPPWMAAPPAPPRAEIVAGQRPALRQESNEPPIALRDEGFSDSAMDGSQLDAIADAMSKGAT